MLLRSKRKRFIEPCLPSRAERKLGCKGSIEAPWFSFWSFAALAQVGSTKRKLHPPRILACHHIVVITKVSRRRCKNNGKSKSITITKLPPKSFPIKNRRTLGPTFGRRRPARANNSLPSRLVQWALTSQRANADESPLPAALVCRGHWTKRSEPRPTWRAKSVSVRSQFRQRSRGGYSRRLRLVPLTYR